MMHETLHCKTSLPAKCHCKMGGRKRRIARVAVRRGQITDAGTDEIGRTTTDGSYERRREGPFTSG